MNKKLLLVLFLISVGLEAFAVKHAEVQKDRMKFHNFSGMAFNAAGMKLTVDNNWYDINNLTVISGNLNVPAGGDLVIGGINVALNAGSVALWYSTVDQNNPSAFDMASFVQYGTHGQAFEALASQVALWVVGEFVHGGPTLTRDNDWSSDGASHWTGTILSVEENNFADYVNIGPVPFTDEIKVVTSGITLEYNYELINLLGSIISSEEGIKEEVLEINTALLEEGLYFIRITDSQGNAFTKRLVKK